MTLGLAMLVAGGAVVGCGPAPTGKVPVVSATAAPIIVPTAVPTVAPTPTPAPTPVPGVPGGLPNATGPVPPNFVRYAGTALDDATGAPIPGVCVYTGPPAGCPLQGTPRTDAEGYFAIDYPAGVMFLWTFEHPDYEGVLTQPIVAGTDPTFRLTHR